MRLAKLLTNSRKKKKKIDETQIVYSTPVGSSSETSQGGYSRRARRISSGWWYDGRVVDFLDGSVNLLTGSESLELELYGVPSTYYGVMVKTVN